MFDFNANTKFVFDENDNVNYVQERTCPRCKTTLSELYRTNSVGCANCYRFFEEEIRTLILKQQGAMNHIGKVSTKHVSKVKIKEQIEKLEYEKNRLFIQKESYYFFITILQSFAKKNSFTKLLFHFYPTHQAYLAKSHDSNLFFQSSHHYPFEECNLHYIFQMHIVENL